MNGSRHDNSGIRRCSWTQLQWKYGILLTIITAYCPCKGNPKIPETVYNQHKCYLVLRNHDVCPCKAFQNDLSKFISQRTQKGNQVVLFININKDVKKKGPIQQTLIHNNNLVNVLKHKHRFPTPATHNRGTKTINAIFVSPSLLDREATRWLQFKHSISNHSVASLDIKLEQLKCKEKYEIVCKLARQL